MITNLNEHFTEEGQNNIPFCRVLKENIKIWNFTNIFFLIKFIV